MYTYINTQTHTYTYLYTYIYTCTTHMHAYTYPPHHATLQYTAYTYNVIHVFRSQQLAWKGVVDKNVHPSVCPRAAAEV